jgi:hypothetical protein
MMTQYHDGVKNFLTPIEKGIKLSINSFILPLLPTPMV